MTTKKKSVAGVRGGGWRGGVRLRELCLRRASLKQLKLYHLGSLLLPLICKQYYNFCLPTPILQGFLLVATLNETKTRKIEHHQIEVTRKQYQQH